MSTAGLQEVYKCIHCGLCLPECPTYRITGLETESPRGRIHLARALLEERIEPGDVFSSHMYLCLGCRACESACPSGVKFGKILEASREVIGLPGSAAGRFFLRLVLQSILPSPRRLRWLATALRLYSNSPFRRLLRAVLPARLKDREALLPDIPRRFYSPQLETLPSEGKRRYRVAFLSGCITSVLFPGVNEATVRVLQRNGCEVFIPSGQTCCGALNVHNGGDGGVVREMARRNVEAFTSGEFDALIVNSAGCGAHIKEYGELLTDDPEYGERASKLSGKVRDISEFLTEIPINKNLGTVPVKITYQDPCHLVHAQAVSAQPRELIRAIPGVELTEMEHPDRCCGSAGIYNVLQPEMSGEVLEEKIESIKATGAAVVVAPNPGCMLQIGNGLKRRALDTEVIHIVELLDRAYGAKNTEG